MIWLFTRSQKYSAADVQQEQVESLQESNMIQEHSITLWNLLWKQYTSDGRLLELLRLGFTTQKVSFSFSISASAFFFHFYSCYQSKYHSQRCTSSDCKPHLQANYNLCCPDSFFLSFCTVLCCNSKFSFIYIWCVTVLTGVPRMKSLIGMSALSKELATDITVKQDWKILKIEKVEVSSGMPTLESFRQI